MKSLFFQQLSIEIPSLKPLLVYRDGSQEVFKPAVPLQMADNNDSKVSHVKTISSIDKLPPIPGGSYAPWLFDQKVSLSRETALAMLLQFSATRLPDDKGLIRSYWSLFLSLFQLLCFIVVETANRPSKKPFSTYVRNFKNAVSGNSKSSKVEFKNGIHGFIYFSFLSYVEQYNAGIVEDDLVTMNLNGIPCKKEFFTPRHCTLETYVNARCIVPEEHWQDGLKKVHFIHENLANSILRLGFTHKPPKKVRDYIELD